MQAVNNSLHACIGANVSQSHDVLKMIIVKQKHTYSPHFCERRGGLGQGIS